MHLFIYLTILTLVGCDQFGTPNSEISFKKLGIVEHSGENYYILYQVNVERLLKSVQPIRSSLETISKNLNDNLKKLNTLKPLRQKKVLIHDKPVTEERRNDTNYDTHSITYTTKSLTDSIQEHISFITADLIERQSELEDYLQSLG